MIHTFISKYHEGSALVVLTSMKLCYFKNDITRGFYFVVNMHNKKTRFDDMFSLFEHITDNDYDFLIHDTSCYGSILKVTNKDRHLVICSTSWDFRWLDFIEALVKLQRKIKAVLLSKRLKMTGKKLNVSDKEAFRGVKNLSTFKKLHLFSADVLHIIIEQYYTQ